MTGVSGDVGHRVAERLLADGHEVVGVDVVPPTRLGGAGVTFHRTDVRNADQVRSALEGCSVVVHLAFILDQSADLARMRDVNVEGTRTVFRTAAELGVGHVVYTSSASAYGASAANDVPLTEESPLRADDLAYAAQKAEVERWLDDEFLPGNPRLGATVLRPAIVLGSGVENFIVRSMAGPRMPVIAGHRPPMQFVHVDDLVSAIVHSVETRITGAYNVASEGWLSMTEIAAIIGRRILEVPEEVAYRIAAGATRLGSHELPPGSIPYLVHPWVMSVDKLAATGWQPRHSNRDAVAVLAADIRDRIVVGPLDLDRTTVRVAGLAGAAAAVGAVGLGIAALRRRRGGRA